MGGDPGAGPRERDRATPPCSSAATRRALAALVTREVGKPTGEALGEVQEVIDTCEFFLSEGRRLYGMTVPSEMPDKQLFTYRTPVGVAAIITAGNFPVAVPSWYIVAGAAVWQRGRLEAGRVRVGVRAGRSRSCSGAPACRVTCSTSCSPMAHATFEGLEQALEQGLVQKVGFTGSTDVGRRVGELCGRHLQSPCLELGGKNPLVVMPDANLELAVEGGAVQRLWDRRPAVHLARDGDRARA